MPENKVGKLVEKAKGDDRSLREYARDSGVDAAIISKIINGTYIPKKTGVYRSLTSFEAAPRGGVTYQQLIKAADSSKSYQAGLSAGISMVGMAATEATLAAVGGMSIAAIGIGAVGAATFVASMSNKKQKVALDKSDQVMNEIKQFVVTSIGLLCSSLSEKGISFKIVKEKNKELLENIFDTYLELEGQEMTEYIFRYAYLTKEHQKNQYFIENIPRSIVEKLTFISPSRKRKVSIVTNYPKAYDYMFSYKDKISYNGELSIILVDVKNTKLLKEDYISHYVGVDSSSELIIV